MPRSMLEAVHKTKNAEKKTSTLISIKVQLIEIGLSDLKDEIKRMSEDEIESEKQDKIVDIVEKVLEFNRQEQEGQGLKILTLDQMLARLPITLAQLRAGNNLEKLKNEIRQILYFLYHSKKLSKTFGQYYLKMEVIFMNTYSNKTNESNKFFYEFTDKLNLKNPNKNIALANLSIYYARIIKLAYSNNNLKLLLQIGMMNLIYLMQHTLFQTFKIKT